MTTNGKQTRVEHENVKKRSEPPTSGKKGQEVLKAGRTELKKTPVPAKKAKENTDAGENPLAKEPLNSEHDMIQEAALKPTKSKLKKSEEKRASEDVKASYLLLKEKVDALQKANAQQSNDYQTENNLILEALHTTQEKLENAFKANDELSSELKIKSQILKKFTDAHEKYWHFDALKTSAVSEKDNTTLWHFTNFLIDGRLIADFQFKLILQESTAGIIFLKNDTEANHPLVRWPTGAQFKKEISCTPAMGALKLAGNQILSNLGTTDWKMLQSLIDVLINILQDSTEIDLSAITDKAEAVQRLNALQLTLVRWPAVLRFDTINIINASHGEHYHNLEVELKNPSSGSLNLPVLTYRISTIDDTDAEFGQHPRLEFPESTAAAFDNWYAESVDGRGPRLELRFAAPNVMDTTVWGNLSDKDKILIAGLVGSAPSQMQEASQTMPGKSERWEDWWTLATKIKTIMAHNTTGSANPAPAPAPQMDDPIAPEAVKPVKQTKPAKPAKQITKAKPKAAATKVKATNTSKSVPLPTPKITVTVNKKSKE